MRLSLLQHAKQSIHLSLVPFRCADPENLTMNKEHVPIPNAPRSDQPPIEILTPQQLAERLQVKASWVYEQTRNRSGVRNPDPLPHIKMGLYLRFDWRDVLAWLERQKQRSEKARTR